MKIEYLPYEVENPKGDIISYGVYVIVNGYNNAKLTGLGDTPEKAREDAEKKIKQLLESE